MATFNVVGLPLGALVVGLALAACSGFSSYGTRMGYQPSGETPGWVSGADGVLTASLHGTSVTVDLSGDLALIAVAVQNTIGEPVEIRMGAEGTSRQLQVGQVLERPLTRQPGAIGSDYVPYNAMQAVAVESGWRAAFYLDSPLGRDPTYGQYFVFTVEARLPSGDVERLSLPLVASNQRVSRQR